MAQRSSPQKSSAKAAAKATAKLGGTSGSGGKPATPKPATAGGRPPVKKKPGKSIVNQKQRPWGLIAATVAIVLFAGAIVGAVIATHKSKPSASSSNPYTMPEVAAAKSIQGVIWKAEPDHNHVFQKVNYDTTPPTGGNHSQIWADCSGTVYPNAIANENAVHMLEHGAVWITYKPGLPTDQVTELSAMVNGVDRMAMSPYPGLKTNISLQAWGYQLFVDNANDSRIPQFIAAVRYNSKVTPEQAAGVTCSDPGFKSKPSTFGNPIFNLT